MPERRDKPASRTSKSASQAHEPQLREYFSFFHPDWWVAELKFVARRLSKLSLSPAPGAPPISFTDLKFLIDLKKRLLEHDGRTEVVYEAVHKLGLAALHSTETERSYRKWNEYEEARALQQVRQLLWEEIERWYWTARRGSTPAERRSAAHRLKKFGQLLAGDLRGRRGSAPTDPLKVREYFYRTLFRLDRAIELLEVWPWGARSREKVRHVAQAVAMSEASLEAARTSYLHLSSKGDEKSRPLTPEYYARVWTAEAFQIDEPTVSNILAGRRARGAK